MKAIAEPTQRPQSTQKARRRRRVPFRGWKALASLKIGVVLLSLLGVAMAAATFYESAHSAKEAQALVYHTAWFNGLLALLAVNIFFVTLKRWPFKLRHAGFLLTHFAILVILGGAVVTMWFGTEGTLRIREGSVSDHLFGDEIAVAVQAVGGSGPSEPAEVVLAVSTTHPARGLGKVHAVERSDVRLKPLAFYPNSQWNERHLPDPAGHPAVELSLSGGAHGGTAWLHAAAGANDILAFGGTKIRLVEVADEASLAQQLQTTPGPAGDQSMGKGVVTVTLDGGPPVKVDVDASLGVPVEIPGTGATLTVTRYVPHAMVGPKSKGLISRSERAVNPAIVLNITGSAGTEQRILFARFPEMSNFHRKGNHWSTLETRYTAPIQGSQERTIALLAGPDEELHYRLSEPDGTSRSGPLTVGHAVLPDELGVSLTIAQYLPKARATREPEPVPIDRKASQISPALSVALVGKQDTEAVWLQWGRPTDVTVDGRTVRLVLGNHRVALPFRIRLEKFEEERYPGLQRAAMWRSHVTVEDPTKGLTLKRVIQMNEPLHYAGFTLFQSSFDLSGPRAVSVLTVSRDPGKWVVYGGFALLIFGASFMVITKRVLRRPAVSQGSQRDREVDKAVRSRGTL